MMNTEDRNVSFLPTASPRVRLGIVVGLLVTLGMLVGHAVFYAFLTDDAFISFRYARNLSNGDGLVFNPGFERVEGYTNFLWVVILAGLNAVGLAPEAVANGVTIALTIGLWALVTWYVCRTAVERGQEWLVLIAPLCLATTRSVAVWATSGLETRLFEVLIVAAALRLIIEIESWIDGTTPRRPWSGLLFALAALTRPDGSLIAMASFAVAGWTLWRRGGLKVVRIAIPIVTFVAIVGGHFVFRRWYYGEWWPNTYYAKVDGRTWWDMGFTYLGCFVLEYAIYLWVPILIAAVAYHRRRRSLHVPLLFAAIVLPHALYVASVGGDHFEYRPLDLYFPFAFILLYDGVKFMARGALRTMAVTAYLVVVLVGLVELPLQSYLQIPKIHIGGFPGEAGPYTGSTDFMRPERDPIYRWPVLRRIAATHLSLLRTTTSSFVGIRREEHRAFLATVAPEGKRLRQLIDEGTLPGDTYIAISCVGAVPYYSDLRTLDRLGLTDAHVAHSEFMKVKRLMAHDKNATIAYAREAGVDFWAVDAVHSIWRVTHPKFLTFLQKGRQQDLPLYTADLGDGEYLLGMLPQGEAAAKKMFMGLTFAKVSDAVAMSRILREAVTAYQEKLKDDPEAYDAKLQYGNVLFLSGKTDEAIQVYQEVVEIKPDQVGLWQNLAAAYQLKGEWDRAIEAMQRAIALADSFGDEALRIQLENRLSQYRKARSPHAAGAKSTTHSDPSP